MLILRSMVVFFLLGSTFAWSDVGMITQTSGKVSIASGDRVQAAVAFYKVSAGSAYRWKATHAAAGIFWQWPAGSVEWCRTDRSGQSRKQKCRQTPGDAELTTLVINQLAKTPAAGQQGKAGMVPCVRWLNRTPSISRNSIRS